METFITYVSQNGFYIWEEFYRHFLMAAYGVLFAPLSLFPSVSSLLDTGS